MNNVATFKTTRNTSTALVVVDDMSPMDALKMHTSVKERGRGAVKAFVENETVYDNYRAYHYRLKKIGVMPLSSRKNKPQHAVKETLPAVVADLEQKIKQLELQLQAANVTPAQRALDVLSSGLGEINYRSRVFLANLIAKDYASISHKQEKWLADLESKHL